jgi:hypothetical protein
MAVARGSTLVLEEGTKTPRRMDLDMLTLDFADTLTLTQLQRKAGYRQNKFLEMPSNGANEAEGRRFTYRGVSMALSRM